MNRTAYFHPAFVEELSLLTPDTRIQFYTELQRHSSSFIGHDRYKSYAAKTPKQDTENHISFYEFSYLPNIYMSCNRKGTHEGMLYLGLTVEDTSLEREARDTAMLEAAQARFKELSGGGLEAISYSQFRAEIADQDEIMIANDIVTDAAQRGFYESLMTLSFDDAKKDTARFFNYTKPQFERFLERIDYFLDSFNKNLGNRCGGQLVLDVYYRNIETFTGKTLRDLVKDEPPRLSD